MINFLATHSLYRKNTAKTWSEGYEPLPGNLVAMLCRLNSNSYSNGFLSFVSPEEFRCYFSLWNLNPAECFPFIKFAFGNLVFYHKSQYKVLNPVYNCIDILGEEDELDFVMDFMLCNRTRLMNSFFIDIYEQSFRRLAAVYPHEIYAFIPPICLGGSRDALNVRKVSMKNEMCILSQIRIIAKNFK